MTRDKSRRLLLAYYGDDFTGSTDVLEALASAGVRTVLFLSPPSPKILAQVPGLRAFGIAGNSRTMSPERMKRNLPRVFNALRISGAPLVHYKICSTFDSSPRLGSIGCAIEIASSIFKPAFVPVIVGAPVLGRYVAFSNLFARSGLDSQPYRLDRHPTMSRHPVTPMDEADLRLLLARQTSMPIRSVDVLQLESEASTPNPFRAAKRGSPHIVIFDTVNESHLRRAGQWIWNAARSKSPLFSASSSGLEYALIAHWRARGLLKGSPPPNPAKRVAQTVVVSGSCSPVTGSQIEWALGNGWAEVPLTASALVRVDGMAGPVAACLAQLNRGRSVILHTARGPDDPRIASANNRSATGGEWGRALGTLLARILEASGLRRAGVTGGDSSFDVAQTLKIQSLEYVAPIAPGSPLCRVHAPGSPADDLEIVFKGGQVGRTDFFRTLLQPPEATGG